MMFKKFLLIIFSLIFIIILVIPVYATWYYNEFSSDVIWIYVEASISGQNSLTSSGSGGVDSGFKNISVSKWI